MYWSTSQQLGNRSWWVVLLRKHGAEFVAISGGVLIALGLTVRAFFRTRGAFCVLHRCSTNRRCLLAANSQEPGQFIVAFPSAYTAHLNTGFNVVESVPAAPPDWWAWTEVAAARMRASRRVPVRAAGTWGLQLLEPTSVLCYRSPWCYISAGGQLAVRSDCGCYCCCCLLVVLSGRL